VIDFLIGGGDSELFHACVTNDTSGIGETRVYTVGSEEGHGSLFPVNALNNNCGERGVFHGLVAYYVPDPKLAHRTLKVIGVFNGHLGPPESFLFLKKEKEQEKALDNPSLSGNDGN
jgi:hypothetical protein